MPRPPHPSAPPALPPSPLVGEGRGPRPQAVGRVRGNAQGLTKRQQLPATVATLSRALCQSAGEPERRLWRALREAFPDAKFRRQVPFGPYHADFCSHAARLIVEVDGDDHALRQNRDALRTRFLNTEGYDVIRFANADVMTNLGGVVASIDARVAHKQKGRP
jgi:very-short-patch-repair endonuclease